MVMFLMRLELTILKFVKKGCNDFVGTCPVGFRCRHHPQKSECEFFPVQRLEKGKQAVDQLIRFMFRDILDREVVNIRHDSVRTGFSSCVQFRPLCFRNPVKIVVIGIRFELDAATVRFLDLRAAFERDGNCLRRMTDRRGGFRCVR